MRIFIVPLLLASILPAFATPTTTISAPSSVGANAPFTVTSFTDANGANLTSQAIDYSTDGGGSWVSGSLGAGSRWEGDQPSNTLTSSFTFGNVSSVMFRARGMDDQYQLSDFVYATVSIVYSPPTANTPTITISNDNSSNVTVSVHATYTQGSNSVTNFHIERSLDGGSTWNVVSFSGNDFSYSDTAVGSHTVTFKCAASDDNQNSWYFSAWQSATYTVANNYAPPTANTPSVTVTNNNTGSVSINVNATYTQGTNPVTNFHIEESTDGGSTWNVVSYSGNTYSYNDTVVGSHTVTFKCAASDDNQNNWYFSSWRSASYTVVNTYAPPTANTPNISVTNNYDPNSCTGSVTVSVHATYTQGTKPVTNFHIEESQDGGGTWTVVSFSGNDYQETNNIVGSHNVTFKCAASDDNQNNWYFSSWASASYTVDGVTLNASTLQFTGAGVASVVSPPANPAVGAILQPRSVAYNGDSQLVTHSIWVMSPSIVDTNNGNALESGGSNLDSWNLPLGWEQYGYPSQPRPAVSLGNRDPFIHTLGTGEDTHHHLFGSLGVPADPHDNLVLDAPGSWQVQAVATDSAGRTFKSSPASITVNPPALPTSIGTYPVVGSNPSKFVGVFWNAGQVDRGIGSWSSCWQAVWQSVPEFTGVNGWAPVWSGHQLYPLIPDGSGGSTLTHTAQPVDSNTDPYGHLENFAKQAGIRMMDVGIDFIIIDHTNNIINDQQTVAGSTTTLTDRVLNTAVKVKAGLVDACSATGSKSPVKMSFLLGLYSGPNNHAWPDDSIAESVGVFNKKVQFIYDNFVAGSNSNWFYYNGKPLLLLYVATGSYLGSTGPTSSEQATVPLDSMYVTTANGQQHLTDVFEIRWMAGLAAGKPLFGTTGTDGKTYLTHWDYVDAENTPYYSGPIPATVAPGGAGAEAALAEPRQDLFGRGPGRGLESGDLTQNAVAWSHSLDTAIGYNPNFLLLDWLEFGSSADEPNPEYSNTVIDNNKFGTLYGDILKQKIKTFKGVN